MTEKTEFYKYLDTSLDSGQLIQLYERYKVAGCVSSIIDFIDLIAEKNELTKQERSEVNYRLSLLWEIDQAEGRISGLKQKMDAEEE